VFDFEAARALPVRGSSFYLGPGHRSVHWEPVEKGPDFAPKERWRSWTRGMHERFEWIAGDQLRSFGYRTVVPPVTGSRDAIRHGILDILWRSRSVARTAVYLTRVKVGTATRPLREHLGLVRSLDGATPWRGGKDLDNP
jgi:hypothetical protein